MRGALNYFATTSNLPVESSLVVGVGGVITNIKVLLLLLLQLKCIRPHTVASTVPAPWKGFIDCRRLLTSIYSKGLSFTA